jgi:hypothetical protein
MDNYIIHGTVATMFGNNIKKAELAAKNYTS